MSSHGYLKLLAFVLIGLVGVVVNARIILPVKDSLKLLQTSDNYDLGIKGQLVSVDYEIYPVENAQRNFDYHGKIWIAVHKIGNWYRVTVVRLDNMMDKFEYNVHHEKHRHDSMWRDVAGWDVELLVRFKCNDYELRVPSNPNHDAMQLDLVEVDFPLAKQHEFRIPKVVYQVPGNFKDVKYPIIEKLMALTRIMSPGWKHVTITEDLIQGKLAEWDSDLLDVYKALAPIAYRIDFFRYMVMYHMGGVYLDSKVVMVTPLDEFLARDKNLIVYDIGKYGLSNSILAFEKGSVFMRNAVRQTSMHVRNKYYGSNSLAISGPVMLKDLYFRLERSEMDRIHTEYQASSDFRHVVDSNHRILANWHNAEYRRRFDQNKPEYHSNLWRRRQVYTEHQEKLVGKKFKWET